MAGGERERPLVGTTVAVDMQRLYRARHVEKTNNIEAAIRRLTREIEQIDQFFEANEQDDRLLCSGMLERKRDVMVRSAVLQMHTAIESLLNSHISLKFTGRDLVKLRGRSQSVRAV